MHDSKPQNSALVRAMIGASMLFVLGGIAMTFLTLQFPPESMVRWLTFIGCAAIIMLLEHVLIRPIFPFQSLRYAFMYTAIVLSASLLSRNIELTSQNILLISLGWLVFGGGIGLFRYFRERQRLRAR